VLARKPRHRSKCRTGSDGITITILQGAASPGLASNIFYLYHEVK
jgi:hypothetical protein